MNTKQPMKKTNTIITLVLVGALLIGLILFIQQLSKPTKEPKINSFETLETALKVNGLVEKISITPVGGENYEWYQISGLLNKGHVGEGKNYSATYFVLKITDGTYSYQEDDIPTNPVLITTRINYIQTLAQKNGITPSLVAISNVNWLSIISTVLMIAIPIILLVVLFKSMSGGGGNSKAFDFGKNRATINKSRSVTFKDVAGCDEEKQELEEVVDFLKNPRKYAEVGARIPKGVLLFGSPGTGKTLLAKAVAGEANVPFFSISGSDFVEMFVGVGASRVRDLFKTAKENSPCIIFIDEIDAVGRQRGAGMGGGHDEREQTLNQLLVEMDGFSPNLGIIIIAATNRPDVLDPALLRPGRFDRQITIDLPDVNGREAILRVHSRNKKISDDVVLRDISMRIPGFSGADIENLLNEAAILAARENRTAINRADIDEAMDRVRMGPAKKSRKFNVNEKKVVAFHEAGHAVIGIKLPFANIVQKVTIIPRGRAGGYNLMTPAEETFLDTKDSLLAKITSYMGGRVAEELVFNSITNGAYGDFQSATQIARAMVTEYGMSNLGPVQYESHGGSVFLGRDYTKERNFSDQIALEIDKEIRSIIDQCYNKAKEIITANRELLDTIANYLLEIETLAKSDIDEIVKTGKLGWWEKQKAALPKTVITPSAT